MIPVDELTLKLIFTILGMAKEISKVDPKSESGREVLAIALPALKGGSEVCLKLGRQYGLIE